MSELRKRGKTWYADFYDRHGKRVRKCTGVHDKGSAEKILAKWVSEERLIDEGLKRVDRSKERIVEHLEKFRLGMVSKGRSEFHVNRTHQLIKSVVDFNGWKAAGEIDPHGIHRFTEHLRDQQRNNRTIGSYIVAMRTFCRWLVRTEVLIKDPTLEVSKPDPKLDRKICRRMVTIEEWRWVRKYLESEDAAIRNGQTGEERLVLYWLAVESGLRAGELLSLTKAYLAIDGKDPHVVVKATNTKNRRTAHQYVSDALAAELRRFTATKLPAAKLFTITDQTNMADVVRRDMDDARKLWLKTADGKKLKDTDFLKDTNHRGERLDFHSWRHTCGSWLLQAGASLVEVQQVLRHSTIELTASTYGHVADNVRARNRATLAKLLG
jgi:integrase